MLGSSFVSGGQQVFGLSARWAPGQQHPLQDHAEERSGPIVEAQTTGLVALGAQYNQIEPTNKRRRRRKRRRGATPERCAGRSQDAAPEPKRRNRPLEENKPKPAPKRKPKPPCGTSRAPTELPMRWLCGPADSGTAAHSAQGRPPRLKRVVEAARPKRLFRSTPWRSAHT